MGNDITGYLENFFSINAEMKPLDLRLPWGVKNWFDASRLTVESGDYLVLSLKNDIEPIDEIWASLRHAQSAAYDTPIIVSSSIYYKSLERIAVKHKIGYVVPNVFCYLPYFVIHAKHITKAVKQERKLGVLPTMICLAYMEGELPRLFKTAQVNIDTSKAAISRAIAELENQGIVQVNRSNKTHLIKFKPLRVKLWQQREKLLSSVASKPVLVKNHNKLKFDCLGNLSALSHYSNLGSPELPFYVLFLDKSLRQGISITDLTINNAALSFLEKSKVEVNPYKTDDIDNVYVQVCPFQLTYAEMPAPAVTSAILTYLSTTAGDPRIAGALSSLDVMIYRELIILDEIEN